MFTSKIRVLILSKPRISAPKGVLDWDPKSIALDDGLVPKIPCYIAMKNVTKEQDHHIEQYDGDIWQKILSLNVGLL